MAIIDRLYMHSSECQKELSQTHTSCGSTGKVTLASDGKLKVVGFDIDGDELTVICVYDNGTLVITVY